MRNLKLERLQKQKGTSLIEYGLLAALIAVAVVTAVSAIGTALNTSFGTIKDKITGG